MRIILDPMVRIRQRILVNTGVKPKPAVPKMGFVSFTILERAHASYSTGSRLGQCHDNEW